MNDQDHIHAEDLALWRQWSGIHDHARPDCPSALDLAGFVDGRCSAEQGAAMESHLAGCDSCALAVSEVRAMAPEQGRTIVFVPPHVIDAARGLVSPAMAGLHTMRVSPLRRGAGWGMAAAVGAAICLGGYQLGWAAQPQPQPSDASLLTAMSFGLVDENDAGDDTFSLMTAATGKEQQ